MRSWIVLTLAAATALALLPKDSRAQDFDSSMSAFCFTADCSIVQFNLNLDPAAYVSDLTWTVESGPGLFDGTVEAEDPSWNLEWLSGGGIQLTADGDPILSPTWFRLGMTNVDYAGQLTDGAVRYDGLAWGSYEDGIKSDAGSFGGHVTPEPITMLLLGTGLAGVGGAGMRRRRKEQEEDTPIV